MLLVSFKSMNAWIPALNNAFQHSFTTLVCLFNIHPSGNNLVSALLDDSPTLFPLVQVYANELVQQY